MARRKLTVVEKAIADAARELSLPRDHWNVERLSTLMVLKQVAVHKFSTTQSSQSAADILALMDSISKLRAEAKLNEPVAITVEYAESFIGICDTTCPHCGRTSKHEIARRPFKDDAATTPTPAIDTAPTSHDKPAVPAEAKSLSDDKVVPLPVVHIREGVSASRFHSQEFASGEVPPLRRPVKTTVW
jgi:hypothetical protein